MADDPFAESLDRVRADLAGLAAAPAPDPPAEVIESVKAALRAESAAHHVVTGVSGSAVHADRAPRGKPSRLRMAGVIVGLAAVALAVVLGSVALVRSPPSELDTGITAKHITVGPSAPDMPLSNEAIIGLLDRPPDFGGLADPRQRGSCLNGLGYSADTPVLGAQPVEVHGQAAVLLVLAAQKPGELAALVVPPNCSTVNTGLIVDTVIQR